MDYHVSAGWVRYISNIWTLQGLTMQLLHDASSELGGSRCDECRFLCPWREPDILTHRTLRDLHSSQVVEVFGPNMMRVSSRPVLLSGLEHSRFGEAYTKRPQLSNGG